MALKIRTMSDVSRLVECAGRVDGMLPPVKNAIRENRASAAQTLTKAYQFALDEVDWTSETKSMSSSYRKQHAETAKAAAAAMIHGALRTINLRQEATTAALDVPTFTRQLILSIPRAYAALFTPQLFRTIPMTGPTARVYFEDVLYNSAFTGSSPTINSGDRTDDLTKFNPGFFATPEGVDANEFKYDIKYMNVEESSYRVSTSWTDQAAQDAASQYNIDIDANTVNRLYKEMMRVVDWNMVLAVYNAVSAANVNMYSWKAQPDGTNGTQNYAAMDVANQRAYDQTFWSVGIQNVLQKIMKTRQYGEDSTPTWAICGTGIPLQLAKVDGYHPRQNLDKVSIATGALRDMGTLEDTGIRFMVSAMVDNIVPGGGANTIIFGHQPEGFMAPGIDWLPYIPLTVTPPLHYPRKGVTEKAVFSRFAISQPNTAAEPASVQLGHIYGVLNVT